MKDRHLASCLTAAGHVAGLAIDHGRSLDAAIQDARGGQARADDALAFKSAVVSVLGSAASVTLVDPTYGPAIRKNLTATRSLIYGYEQDIYRKDGLTLVPELPPDWSVHRLVAISAHGIKLFLYFDPDAQGALTEQRKIMVERVGAECASAGVPFFLEPITTSVDPRQRARQVLRAVEEFSQDHYHVDVLKIEMPVQPRQVPEVFSRAQAADLLQEISAATTLPLVFLGGGVPLEQLIECLEFAGACGSRFNGVLCGRSIWSDGVPVFARRGVDGLAQWLERDALPAFQRLARAVETHAAALLPRQESDQEPSHA